MSLTALPVQLTSLELHDSTTAQTRFGAATGTYQGQLSALLKNTSLGKKPANSNI